MNTQFDVCIVGGGLIGTTAACALGDLGLRVALVDDNQPAPRLSAADDYTLRVSAINTASVQLFKSLGIWPSIKAIRVSPYTDMQIWDGDIQSKSDHTPQHQSAKLSINAQQAAIQFHSHDLALPQLGYIIENDAITQALNDKITYLPTVERFSGQGLTGFTQHKTEIEVELDHSKLQSSLLIGADGQDSSVRQLAQIPVEYGLFDQLAIVARIQTSQPHQQTAYQHFLNTGPIAYLPLADGSSSIVWSCDKNHAKHLMAMPDQAFSEAVASAMQHQLGDVTLLSKRAAFPLKQIHAQRYISERIALIGDAAHRTHPLAGLGANIGFVDAAALAEIVGQAHLVGRDIGLTPQLRKYERWRRAQNDVILKAMQGFKTAFGSEHPGVVSMRRLGLSVANQTPPIKTLFTRLAMGIGSDLPKACQSPSQRI